MNRLIHGSGVVCGLDVLQTVENAKVVEGKITISPGVALDPSGREIVIPAEVVVDLNEKIKPETQSPITVFVKYAFCVEETADKVLETSPCKDQCCPSIMKESYTIEFFGAEKTTTAPSSESPASSQAEDGICKDWNDFLVDQKNTAFCVRKCPECPQSDDDNSVFLAEVYFKNTGSLIVDRIVNYRASVYSNDTLYRLIKCVKAEKTQPIELPKEFPRIKSMNWGHGFTCHSIREWVTACQGDFNIVFNVPMNKSTLNRDTVTLTLERYVEAEESLAKDIVAVPRSFVVFSDKTVEPAAPTPPPTVVSSPPLIATPVTVATRTPIPLETPTVAPVYATVRPALTPVSPVFVAAPTATPAPTPVVSTTPAPAPVTSAPTYVASTVAIVGMIATPFLQLVRPRTIVYIEKFDIPIVIKESDKTTFVFSRAGTDANNERVLSDQKYLQDLISKKLKIRFRLIIQIKGDFVQSESGKCLDGNFLRGMVPTGNGSEGGLFESWFSLEIPGVSEELEISPKITEALTAVGKSVNVVIDTMRSTGIKLEDTQNKTPVQLAAQLNIPEVAASEIITTAKTVKEFNELDETNYDSLKKIKTLGLSRVDVANSASAADLGTKIGVSEDTATRLISKAKSVQPT